MSIKVRQFFKKSFFAYIPLDNISFSMFNISFLAFRKMDFLHFPRGYNSIVSVTLLCLPRFVQRMEDVTCFVIKN
jgi:hypothetical protein